MKLQFSCSVQATRRKYALHGTHGNLWFGRQVRPLSRRCQVKRTHRAFAAAKPLLLCTYTVVERSADVPDWGEVVRTAAYSAW